MQTKTKTTAAASVIQDNQTARLTVYLVLVVTATATPVGPDTVAENARCTNGMPERNSWKQKVLSVLI